MQREIKFRARHIKNKRWYYGIETDCKADSFLPLGVFWLWVEFGILDRKTVGESTGLKDKHKIKIYEGDIVVAEDEYTDRILDDGTGPREPWNHLAPVEFHNGNFGIAISKSGDNYSSGFWPFERILNDIGDKPSEMEVIGNIWENPELLKPPMTSDETAEERSR